MAGPFPLELPLGPQMVFPDQSGEWVWVAWETVMILIISLVAWQLRPADTHYRCRQPTWIAWCSNTKQKLDNKKGHKQKDYTQFGLCTKLVDVPQLGLGFRAYVPQAKKFLKWLPDSGLNK